LVKSDTLVGIVKLDKAVATNAVVATLVELSEEAGVVEFKYALESYLDIKLAVGVGVHLVIPIDTTEISKAAGT
jgi:hypothetical protein